ncbi:MAG: MarR family winged helix-turn-helix transcriptional regulator [Pseudomonadota bacterium]
MPVTPKAEQFPQRSQLLLNLWLCSEAHRQMMDQSLGSIHGIAYIEYLVLHHLAQAPGEALRRIDLARTISRSASGVTRLLRPMEKIGLVSKVLSERDARVSIVALTDAGRERLRDATRSLNQLSEKFTASINDREVARMESALAALAARPLAS